MYIGQTINPATRFQQHKHDAQKAKENNQFNIALYNAINKYGIENFSFEIIEECLAKDLELREPYWISTLNTIVPNGYNILKGGKHLFGENNPFYGKHHSEETKQKLSESHKNIFNGENNPMYGKHHTEETKEKIKQKNLDKNMYEYHKQRMMNNRTWEDLSKVKPVFAINHETKQVLLFYTKARAGKYIFEKELSKTKYTASRIKNYLEKENLKGSILYGFEWIYAHDLIGFNFFSYDFSTCGNIVNFLISSNKDKTQELFYPYFTQNKDDIIDFSNYYNEIKESLLTAQMLKKEVSIYVLGENSK